MITTDIIIIYFIIKSTVVHYESDNYIFCRQFWHFLFFKKYWSYCARILRHIFFPIKYLWAAVPSPSALFNHIIIFFFSNIISPNILYFSTIYICTKTILFSDKWLKVKTLHRHIPLHQCHTGPKLHPSIISFGRCL